MAPFPHQLNDCLNSNGERLVFVLNNLLNDCGCSKPNSYAISLTDKPVVYNLSFAFSISFSGLLLITVTACPFCTNSSVSGLLMCPNEPVIIIFISLVLI
ncbi:MAG: hypothetical protein JWQ85_4308 [Mucilaginibacter sp.]|nr:hypothetical protein [Mucilaginibacter sp.]